MASRTDARPGAAAPHVIEFETEASGPGAPHIPESPPFLLTFHRHRWRVVFGMLVPALSKFSLIAGSNRVEVLEGGKIRMAEARAKLEREGRMVIPQEWGPIVTGDGRRTYVSHVTTVPSGSSTPRLAHLTAWESWAPGSSDVYRDEEGYAKWLKSLVDSGRLPACSQDDAKKLLADAQRKLGVAEAIASGLRSGVVASAAAKVKILKQEVEVLEAYLATFARNNAQRFGGQAAHVDVDDEDPRVEEEEGQRRREEERRRQEEESQRRREEERRRQEEESQRRREEERRRQEEELAAREQALRDRELALAEREKSTSKVVEAPSAEKTTPKVDRPARTTKRID